MDLNQINSRIRKHHETWKDNPRNAEQMREARSTYATALRNQKLTRPSHCEVCDEASNRIHGHHADYSKPTEVVWVCPKCHANIHHCSEIKIGAVSVVLRPSVLRMLRRIKRHSHLPIEDIANFFVALSLHLYERNVNRLLRGKP